MFDAFQICKNTLAMEPSTYYVSSCKGEGALRKRQFLFNLCTKFLSSHKGRFGEKEKQKNYVIYGLSLQMKKVKIYFSFSSVQIVY